MPIPPAKRTAGRVLFRGSVIQPNGPWRRSSLPRGNELRVRLNAVVRRRMATIRFLSCGALAMERARVLPSRSVSPGLSKLSRLAFELLGFLKIESSRTSTQSLLSLQLCFVGRHKFSISPCSGGLQHPIDPQSTGRGLQSLLRLDDSEGRTFIPEHPRSSYGSSAHQQTLAIIEQGVEEDSYSGFSKRPAFFRSCDCLSSKEGKGGEAVDDPASVTACKSPRWRASARQRWRGIKRAVNAPRASFAERQRSRYLQSAAASCVTYSSRRASSASSARRFMTLKNSFDWPMKRPSVAKLLKEATAPPSLCRGRANDRNGRKPSVVIRKKMGWLGHDQVGLQCVPVEGFRIRFSLGVSQGCERHRCPRSPWSVVHVSQWERIAGLILPGLKVHGLAWTNTQ